ncbi:Endoplasmic reticulum membrane-associated RNA degradation protein [Holothuria leucospilota]|uniref:Endoplasmic reticulum membrane-associated RNA degradation protein n=1 Tax=Holothuria leucospilota TaxID=206669 RepID=A0A9Q1HHG3_HOLLE|nr:Endoplasmic reticulum membrane-associated RNA degradation protein [Holothuria leucospilota]
MEGVISMETYLSPSVHHLVCIVGSQENHGVSNVDLILDARGFVQWTYLHKLLFESYDGSWQEEVCFNDHVSRLAPVTKAVLDHITQQDQAEVMEKYQEWWSWTSDAKTLARCFESLLTVSSSACTETSLLLATAILERSLGNVFLLKNSNCPSLLKDLLVTDELEKTFGETALFCLRILLGPPTSLNLRNLLWHGFVNPSEISKRYAVFLLVLVGSLGGILEEQGIKVTSNSQRDFIDITKQASLVEANFTAGVQDSIHEFESFLLASCVIPKNMVLFLTDALEYFKHERFSWSAALLLPLLESTLRQLYAKVNNCPERVLTAESATLFTTFDEILSNTLIDGSENQLPFVVGEGLMEMLLDLLVYPDGPRLRDHLSHGELDFHSIPSSLVSFIITILISLSAKLCARKKTPENKVVRDLVVFCESYQSVFHPFSYFIRDYINICEGLNSWLSLPQPSSQDLQYDKSVQNGTKEFKVIQNCKNVVIEVIGPVIDADQRTDILRFMEPFSDALCIVPYCKALELKTLFRPKSEQHLVTILHQIVQQCSTVSSNICTISSVRFDQWKTRQLRSRQRVNYIRFLQSIPCLSSGVRLVLVILLFYTKRINSWSDDTKKGPSAAAHIKFLKKVLQYSENVSSLTEKNKWDEIVSLTEKFTDLFEKFSVFHEYLTAD